MEIDITLISQWCTALVAIIVFLKYVSAPIKIVLENNKKNDGIIARLNRKTGRWA